MYSCRSSSRSRRLKKCRTYGKYQSIICKRRAFIHATLCAQPKTPVFHIPATLYHFGTASGGCGGDGVGADATWICCPKCDTCSPEINTQLSSENMANYAHMIVQSHAWLQKRVCNRRRHAVGGGTRIPCTVLTSTSCTVGAWPSTSCLAATPAALPSAINMLSMRVELYLYSDPTNQSQLGSVLLYKPEIW